MFTIRQWTLQTSHSHSAWCQLQQMQVIFCKRVYNEICRTCQRVLYLGRLVRYMEGEEKYAQACYLDFLSRAWPWFLSFFPLHIFPSKTRTIKAAEDLDQPLGLSWQCNQAVPQGLRCWWSWWWCGSGCCWWWWWRPDNVCTTIPKR